MKNAYTGELRFEDGKPTLYVNGKKTLPMIYALTDIPAFDSLTEQAQRNMRQFSEQGIRLIQAHIFLYRGWHKATGYDVDHVIGELNGVLSAVPDAAIMLRLHLGAPYWWLRDHPEEICVFGDGGEAYIDNGEYERLVAGDEERYMRASLASEKWKHDTSDILKEFCRRVAETDEGKHIFAIQIAGGVYAEWHQWGFTHQPDYGTTMVSYFRKWLKQKYQTVEALQKAWKQENVTFENAQLAPPATRHLNADGSYGVPEDGVCFRVPENEVWAVDSLRVLHCAAVDAICTFSDVIKAAWPTPILTGTFYGYYDGGFASASVGGHLDVVRLMRSGKIDFMAAPFPYHPFIRGVEGVSIARGFLESMRLNHVLWLTEMDCAPVGTKERVGGDPDLLMENTAVLKRHAIEPFLRGHGMWFFDHRMFPSNIYLKKGWWDTPHFMKEIGALRSLCQEKAGKPYLPQADVLLVWDSEYYYYMPHINLPHYGVMYPFMEAIGKSGVCYDSIYLQDLEKAEMDRYRAVVFMTAVRLTAGQRQFIQTNVARNNRHLIWMHANGWMDETDVSEEKMSETIGVCCTAHIPENRMRIGEKEIEIAELFDPAFAVKDEHAVSIAYYPDGAVAAARKTVADHTTVVFQLPPIDTVVLRELFRNAGAHIYSENGEALLVGSGMIAVTLPKGGEVTLRLRNGTVIKDKFETSVTAVYDSETGVKMG